MWDYRINYTLVKFEEKKNKTEHKVYDYQSENDLLAAADEGMSFIYEQNPKADEIIFRKIELINAKEFYEQLCKDQEEVKL